MSKRHRKKKRFVKKNRVAVLSTASATQVATQSTSTVSKVANTEVAKNQPESQHLLDDLKFLLLVISVNLLILVVIYYLDQQYNCLADLSQKFLSMF